MRREFRLKKKEDFKLLFTRGKRIDSSLFRLVYRNNSIGHVRLAFVAPRSIEKRSVLRNRLRRRSREWVRVREELISQAMDIAIIFKKEAISVPKSKFYEELDKTLARIRAI